METPQITRRGVAKGALWSVPAVATAAAAPAIAASQQCTFTTSTWTAQNSSTSATGSNGVTASSTANGGTRLRSTNFGLTTVSNGQVFNGQQWLTLDQAAANAQGQTVTINFSQPAYCVTFYINDIDTQYGSNTSKYRDQVTVTGFTASTTSGYVTTSGGSAYATNTATSSTSTTYEFDNTTSANGLAKFTATGPVSSITLTYINSNASSSTSVNDNQQQVYISPIQYSTSTCAC